jgi:phosphohistidine phosphatase
MGEHPRNKHLVPDAIISSTAVRAHATTKAVAKASGYKGEVTLNRSLYAAGPRAYLDVLHDLSDDYVRVLIVGHNPGLEELVEMLTAEIHVMPTCSLVQVKLHVDSWLDIDYETKGELVDIWQPGA